MKNRIKLLAASLWLAASPLVPLRVYAERTNSDKERENVVWVNPMDRYGMVWASNLADSVMHILEREYVPFVFIEIPTMAGSLCNRYIQGELADRGTWLARSLSKIKERQMKCYCPIISKLGLAACLLATTVSCFKGKKNESRSTDDVTATLRQTTLSNRECVADSISATKVWQFRYTDGVFPCTTEGGCMIKGLDTDGEGHFYIAGGEPIRLVCYQGTKYIWGREISQAKSNDGLLHLVRDSLYFVEEDARRILRMHKDGRGEIEYWTLKMGMQDSIALGEMFDTGYLIVAMDTTIAYKRSEERDEVYRGYRFAYPVELQDTVHHADNLSKLDKWGAPSQEFGYCHGKVGELLIYVSQREYHHAVISICTESGDRIGRYAVRGLPPVQAVCGEDHAGWYPSPNLDALRRGLLYLSGYDFEKEIFQIHEFDIGLLCDKLEHRDK